jgi:hypothetical protein
MPVALEDFMRIQAPAFAEHDRFTGEAQPDPPGVVIKRTRDHDAIRRWAARHDAAPATGEATASGPATVEVNDGGAGIRFNFPGFAPFRPISWGEWLANFDRYGLTFVYEDQDTTQIAARARELWHEHGSAPGRDKEDWYEAENDLRRAAGGRSPSARYRFVKDVADAKAAPGAR